MILRRLPALLLILLLEVLPAQARQALDPNLNILWPLPVVSVSGGLTVVGTANLPGMSGYFLEFRRLIDFNLAQADSVPWSPASLPVRGTVVNGVLGVWDTRQVADGLYELRITAFTNALQPSYARVSPLRVLNNPPPFAALPTMPPIIVVPATLPPATFPPLPTAASGNAQALAVLDANVRKGDSILYETVGALLTGQSAPVIGVSSTGSGWWLIILANGRQGWIAPSTVRISGNTGVLPFINPPPPPTSTPTPTPTATATLQLPNATITRVRFDRTPKQGESFNVVVTVLNASLNPLPSVTVACNFTPGNVFVSQPLAGLAAFGQIDVNIPTLLTSGGGANVTAGCTVDVNNQVAEVNESDNFLSLTTLLEAP